MEFFENLYTEQKEKQLTDDEALQAFKYNHELGIIREIIMEIIVRARTQHPSECEWITMNNKRYVSWNMSSFYDSESHSHRINLISNGDLALTDSNDNWKIILERHVDKVPASSCTDITIDVIIALRISLIRNAQQEFGVNIKKSWTDKSDKPKNIFLKFFRS